MTKVFLSAIFWVGLMSTLVWCWNDPEFRSMLRVREVRDLWIAVGMLLSISWLIVVTM